MNNFLKECFKFRNLANICYVIGNESCDLDSAVSAISLAYYYNKNKDKIFNKKLYEAFVPILNVTRSNYPIKTEVTYFLGQHKIEAENICFIDEVNNSSLETSDIILVDHHFSPLRNNVIQVIDHHQFDTNANLRVDCDTTINLVGSCSSLIADLILKLENIESYTEILNLLYGPIVLDTVNFSKEADKARELDFEVCNKIENMLKISNEYKQEMFTNLVNARASINGLNAFQILFKDMKLVSNQAKTFKVAIPGFPTLVKNFIKMADAETHIKQFAESQDCSIIVLMGMKIEADSVQRDLGIIDVKHKNLFENIVNGVSNCKEPNLNLEKYENIDFLNGAFFNQKNIKASRKQILPLVKKIMEEIIE